jgi:hypothetical protein
MVTVGRGEDLPRVLRTEIPAEEVFVTVINGEPGVNNIKLKVNKTVFEVNDLEDGERRHLNIAKAMRKGTNRVTITAQGGKRGASAVIIISDVPTP